MSIRNVTMGINHSRFEKDVRKLLEKHAGNLDSSEMLAIAAKMVGMIAALQDQRTMTPQRAIEIVIANFQNGNERVVSQLRNAPPAGNA